MADHRTIAPGHARSHRHSAGFADPKYVARGAVVADAVFRDRAAPHRRHMAKRHCRIGPSFEGTGRPSAAPDIGAFRCAGAETTIRDREFAQQPRIERQRHTVGAGPVSCSLPSASGEVAVVNIR
jgi:hypothetical protein